MIEILSGFVLGLFGSLHCVGMCGPLVLSLPMAKEVRYNVIKHSFYYNGGRAMTYAILGVIMGSLGWCVELSGIQRLFSIILGVIMIYGGLCHYFPRLRLLQLSSTTRLISRTIQNRIGPLMSRQTSASNYLKIGMLNGFIPCGLVYVALATSVTLGHPMLSGSYMLFFGIGTIPLMAIVMIGGNLHKRMSQQLRKYLPLLAVLLGLYLIWRGIMLNVVDDPTLIRSGLARVGCH